MVVTVGVMALLQSSVASRAERCQKETSVLINDNDNHAEENVKENLIFNKCKVCSKMVMSSRMKAHMNKFHKATWTVTEVTDDVELEDHPPVKRLKLRKACTVDSSANPTKSTDFDISAALCERLDERLD